MSSDLDEQLATLAREQGRLEALLSIDENWRALTQLDAREARGEAFSSIDGTALRARLVDSLKYNRLYQARTKILEAIAILTESAALPSFAIPPSASSEPEPPAPSAPKPEPVVAAVPAAPPPVAEAAEPAPQATATAAALPPEPTLAETHPAAAVEPPQPDPRRAPPRATIHAAPPVALEPQPMPDSIRASDLLKIRGITPALASRLQSLGVEHAGDIAVWATDDVHRVSAALGLGRAISRENWIEQAALIVQRSGQKLPTRQSIAPPPPAPTPPLAPVVAEPATEALVPSAPLAPAIAIPEPAAAEMPAPPKPAPATVATIVAGAARSIAERIERLRQAEDTDPGPPSKPDDRVAKPIVERTRDNAGPAPARHTPTDYRQVLSRAAIGEPEPVDASPPAAEPETETPLAEVAAPVSETWAPLPAAEPPAPIIAPAPLPVEAPARAPGPAAAPAATLPVDIESRLNNLERDVELTATEDYVDAEPAPDPHALNGKAAGHVSSHASSPFPNRTAPIVPDVGVTASDPVPRTPEPTPPPHTGNEAEIEIIRRQAQDHVPGPHADTIPPPSPVWAGNPNLPESFDARDYDAYRGQSEEASVEIVRSDRTSRTRLPGKPRSSEPPPETTASVRRFLNALKGK